LRDLFQFLCHGSELFQCGFQVLDDFCSDDAWGRKTVNILQAVIFEPENIKVQFIALYEFIVRERAEAFCLFTVFIYSELLHIKSAIDR
jgi:hypothetical protein